MNDARRPQAAILAQLHLLIFVGLKRSRAMIIVSSELAIGELTALFCAIILTLIPLTIWLFCHLESQKGWIQRGQSPVRAKIN
jgi:hypothetical protein